MHTRFFAGGEGGGERTFLHGTVNWMRARHADLGGLGACPLEIFLEIFCSEIESGGLRRTCMIVVLVYKTDSAIISPYMLCYCP